MNIQRILCPIDFSDFNQSANEYASMLAQSTGAKVVYLHVSLPEVLYGTNVHTDLEKEEQHELRRLQEIKPTHPDVEASYVVKFGLPSDRIVEYAVENEVDLIVMGTHGRTGLRRALMGSIAEAVVRKADCPVLAIKAGTQVLQGNS